MRTYGREKTPNSFDNNGYRADAIRSKSGVRQRADLEIHLTIEEVRTFINTGLLTSGVKQEIREAYDKLLGEGEDRDVGRTTACV